jgi:hypothetical protein
MVLREIPIEQLKSEMDTYRQKRDADIISMRNSGATYQVIANKWGIKKQRAQQIYAKYILELAKRTQPAPEVTNGNSES